MNERARDTAFIELTLQGKAETKQTVSHKENILIKTAHWAFVQNIISFTELRQRLDAKKTLGSLAYTSPSKQALRSCECCRIYWETTEVSVTLTHTQKVDIIYAPLGGGAVKCLFTETMSWANTQ